MGITPEPRSGVYDLPPENSGGSYILFLYEKKYAKKQKKMQKNISLDQGDITNAKNCF